MYCVCTRTFAHSPSSSGPLSAPQRSARRRKIAAINRVESFKFYGTLIFDVDFGLPEGVLVRPRRNSGFSLT
jgi:hypothetical protein